MKKVINWAIDKTKSFTVFDWAVFKVLLMSVGAMVGAYFSSFFKKFAPIVWIFIGLSYAYMIYRFFFCKGKKIKVFKYKF